jgi:hypothetical protein
LSLSQGADIDPTDSCRAFLSVAKLSHRQRATGSLRGGYPLFPLKETIVCRTVYRESGRKDLNFCGAGSAQRGCRRSHPVPRARSRLGPKLLNIAANSKHYDGRSSGQETGRRRADGTLRFTCLAGVAGVTGRAIFSCRWPTGGFQ